MISQAVALLAVASALVGMREEPLGSNRGPIIDLMNLSAGAELGSPWCASAAHWCFEQAGMPGRPGAWSPSWFAASRRIERAAVRPGDQGVIWFASLGRYAHTITAIESVRSRLGKPVEVVTLEGNTNKQGSREGDGFFRRIRPANTVTFVRWTDSP